jgi:hypothetical protein
VALPLFEGSLMPKTCFQVAEEQFAAQSMKSGPICAKLCQFPAVVCRLEYVVPVAAGVLLLPLEPEPEPEPLDPLPDPELPVEPEPEPEPESEPEPELPLEPDPLLEPELAPEPELLEPELPESEVPALAWVVAGEVAFVPMPPQPERKKETLTESRAASPKPANRGRALRLREQ